MRVLREVLGVVRLNCAEAGGEEARYQEHWEAAKREAPEMLSAKDAAPCFVTLLLLLFSYKERARVRWGKDPGPSNSHSVAERLIDTSMGCVPTPPSLRSTSTPRPFAKEVLAMKSRSAIEGAQQL